MAALAACRAQPLEHLVVQRAATPRLQNCGST
jgi:hypothetical protein